MIKLRRPEIPPALTSPNAERLKEEFDRTNKAVWNKREIKEPLLESSFGKCAYCECKIDAEAHYVEVEHFRDKKHYPSFVVEWTNLLPSCKRCNVQKSTHDVVSDPIVNPYEEDPRSHFVITSYRFRPKTCAGRVTIDVLDLNDSERAVISRFRVGEKINELVEHAKDNLRIWLDANNTRTRNRCIRIVRSLLIACQPSSAYAATAATELVKNQDYLDLESQISDAGLWDANLQELRANAAGIALR